MRTKLLAIVLLCCAGFCAFQAVAHAEGYLPTQTQIQEDHAIAVAYWKSNIDPPVAMQYIMPPNRTAQANFETGTIELLTGLDWQDSPGITCVVYVHEYGHLVLGPIYFATSNPTDPAHSPDPNNIMYGGGEQGDGPLPTLEQQETQANSVGCPPIQPPKPPEVREEIEQETTSEHRHIKHIHRRAAHRARRHAVNKKKE